MLCEHDLHKEKGLEMNAIKVINNFVHLAICEDVPLLAQSGPVKFIEILFIRLQPAIVLIVPVCKHPSCSPFLHFF